MDKLQFVNLCSRGWSLPFLVALQTGTMGRMSALAAKLRCNRTVARDTLLHLAEFGLIERQSGVGHPLQAEFVLSEKGAELAQAVGTTIPHLADDEAALLRLKWAMPILVTLDQPLRFNALARELPTPTDRALSQTLGRLEQPGWVSRRVDDTARPLAVFYNADGIGQEIGENVRQVLNLRP